MIASKYKFSTRMLETILGWDLARAMVKESLRNEATQTKSVRYSRLPGGDAVSPKLRQSFRRTPDPERAIARFGGPSRPAPPPGLEFHQDDIEMYKLLQEQYNYTTIDHGSNCEWSLDKQLVDSKV